jgi:hypothetical protein
MSKHCLHAKQDEISSAKVAHVARHGREYGTVTASVTVGMATVRRRKREMVERQVAKHLQLYRTSGAELIMGSGRRPTGSARRRRRGDRVMLFHCSAVRLLLAQRCKDKGLEIYVSFRITPEVQERRERPIANRMTHFDVVQNGRRPMC